MIVVKYINGVRCVYKKKRPTSEEFKIIDAKVKVPKLKKEQKE